MSSTVGRTRRYTARPATVASPETPTMAAFTGFARTDRKKASASSAAPGPSVT